MIQLLIKNFGPITVGHKSNDGFIDIRRCSVFIGPQGSGKSCLVKLVSLFSWLEKSLIAGTLDEKIESNTFVNKYLAYHGIAEYLNEKTELEYRGNSYNFSFRNGTFSSMYKNGSYVRPKILYIPADRSFCTAIKNPGKISGLPENTFDFLWDFTDAELGLKKDLYNIPINGFCFSYDEKEKLAFLVDKDKKYKIDISSASSGILSALPLTLTTAYYSGFLSVRPMSQSLEQVRILRDDAFGQLQKLKSALDEMGDFDEEESELERKAKLLHDLEKELDALKNSMITPNLVLTKIVNSRLINIVEEPEQNLFPEAQADILYYLIQCMNSGSVLGGENSLIFTTHSPYIVEALNNSIYAKRLLENGKDLNGLLESNELVSYDDVTAYKLTEGMIESIKDDETKQIDSGYLDSCSERIRTLYSKLEDLEFSDE